MREVSRKPLVVEGGRQLYVEPAAFVANSRGEVLLGGSTNFLTSFGPDGKVNGMSRDSVFGAVIRPDGSAHIVGAPIEGRLMSGIRAVARRDGGWEVVFAEVRPYVGTDRPDSAVRLWHGVYDGDRWTGLEQLPLPPEAVLRPNLSSSLAQRGDSLAWAMQMRAPHGRIQIALFERRNGHWVYELVPTFHARVELSYSDTLGLMMAVVQADTAVRRDGNSLFLWTRHPTWKKLRRIVYGSAEGPTYSPSLTHSLRGAVLSWQAGSPDTSRNPHWETRALIGGPEGHGPAVVTLDSNSVNRQYSLSPVYLLGGGMRVWVLEHKVPERRETEIRFARDTVGGVVIMGRVSDPYMLGFVATAAISPTEVLTAGLHYIPNQYVVSLLLRARVECRGRKP